ncbi:hypothetical protein [Crossiella sp. CA198]|uniref:hypothetical protein n=1 Tax=Crossiella sp. CA198 TaxID=3455607 RepID=UPI003F8D5C81
MAEMGFLDKVGEVASGAWQGVKDGYNWAMGNVRPAGHGGDQIYQWFHQGKGTEPTVSPKQKLWGDVARKYDDMQREVEAILRDFGSWQGKAADTARESVLPLAKYAEAAKQVAEQTGGKVGNQGNDWHGAKHKLRPVSGEMPQNNIINRLTPGETDLDRDIQKFKSDTSHNQVVLAGYGVATNGNLTTMPSWAPPATATGDTSLVQTPPGGGGGSDRGRDPGRGGIRPGGSGSWPGGQGRTGVDQPPRGGDLPPGGRGDQPPPGGGTDLPPGGGPVQRPAPIDGTPVQSVEDPVRPPGGGGQYGGGGLGGGGAGGAGYGGGFAGAGFGPGGSGGGSGGRAGVGGFGPTGTAGAAATAGRPGAPGMGAGPMGGGAGARGEEDKEHQRPDWLVESEEFWGIDGYVAPPVIGES